MRHSIGPAHLGGYVAILPDGFGSRDKTDVCNEPMVMLPGARVLDVIGAAEYLATLPFVPHDQIALIGFPHGAGTVIDALQDVLSSVGMRGGVAYYPLCIPEKHANVALPLLVFMGDRMIGLRPPAAVPCSRRAFAIGALPRLFIIQLLITVSTSMRRPAPSAGPSCRCKTAV